MEGGRSQREGNEGGVVRSGGREESEGREELEGDE